MGTLGSGKKLKSGGLTSKQRVFEVQKLHTSGPLDGLTTTEKTSVPGFKKGQKVKAGRFSGGGYTVVSVKQLGPVAKSANVDIPKLQRRYKLNENRNNHSENAVLLAEAFGTDQEARRMRGIIKARDMRGFIEGGEFKDQTGLNNKYFKKLFP